MEAVLTAVEEKVATITLNRPEVFNALDRGIAVGLALALEKCANDANVRVIILTGAGPGFCSGGDIKAAWKHVQGGGNLEDFFNELLTYFDRVIRGLRGTGKPVIAAINGATSGAGLSLATACDLRIAAESAKFKQAYTSIGLVPDGAWTATVAALIGPAKAMELIYLDPVLTAQQALQWGLVNEVVPDAQVMARARELALRLAEGPAQAFATSKALVNAAQFAGLQEAFDREKKAIVAQSTTAEFRERVQRFVATAKAQKSS